MLKTILVAVVAKCSRENKVHLRTADRSALTIILVTVLFLLRSRKCLRLYPCPVNNLFYYAKKKPNKKQKEMHF